MTEFQAQLGINQLKNIDQISRRRFKIFKSLNEKKNKSQLIENIEIPKLILYLLTEYIFLLKTR